MILMSKLTPLQLEMWPIQPTMTLLIQHFILLLHIYQLNQLPIRCIVSQAFLEKEKVIHMAVITVAIMLSVFLTWSGINYHYHCRQKDYPIPPISVILSQARHHCVLYTKHHHMRINNIGTSDKIDSKHWATMQKQFYWCDFAVQGATANSSGY